jgi:hypothetical protein
MPVDMHNVAAIAATTASIYREGETALLRAITDRLALGLDATDWQKTRLDQIHALRRDAQKIAVSLTLASGREVRAAIAAGWRSGAHDAVAELATYGSPTIRPAGLPAGAAARRGSAAIQALADATVQELRPLHAAILPRTIDVYRRAVAGAAARRLSGAVTTRQAAQAAWSALAARGITTFTTVDGRQLRLHTYVDMSVRTAVHRAAIVGLVDEFTAAGVRLVSVDDRPGECPRCRPWEQQVLALWGPTGWQQVPHARTGVAVTVNVVATLDQAMAAGLMHPNCLHTIRSYRPGVSLLIKAGRTADPDGNTARARQREIERTLRHWREMALTSLTDQAHRQALNRIAVWDAEMAAHIRRHKLTRVHYREQIGAGIIPPAGRVNDRAALLGIPEHLPTST